MPEWCKEAENGSSKFDTNSKMLGYDSNSFHNILVHSDNDGDSDQDVYCKS